MALKKQIIDQETGEIKTEKTLNTNGNFVMLFRAEMKSLRALMVQEPRAAALFMLISEKMNMQNSLIASRETLASYMGVSRATISRSIDSLKKADFIKTSRAGNVTVIHVNANIVWTTYANSRRYAEFSAQVLISDGEQEKDYEFEMTQTKTLSTVK